MRYVFILLALSAQLFAVTNRIEIIIITPPEVLLSPGQTVQMHAYGYYSDGTVTDFTSKVTWSSIQSSIATVSSTGLVTMKGAGSALIKAAYSGYKGYGTVWNKFTPFIRVKPSTASFGKIEHIVYIVKENRSFDSYFGTFPGANGATSGTISTGQVVTLGHLPDPPTHDMGHEWTDNHGNIDGGRMDRFDLELTCSVNGDMACMDQLYQSDIPNYWSYAQNYALADAAFSSVSSGSYPAHLAMISGSAQRVLDNPRNTQPAQWGCDAVAGTTVPFMQTNETVAAEFPCFSATTIGDLADAAGVSWKAYTMLSTESGYIYNPFRSFSSIFYGSDWTTKVVDEANFIPDALAGNLPALSFVTPPSIDTDHPPDSACIGENWTVQQINASVTMGQHGHYSHVGRFWWAVRPRRSSLSGSIRTGDSSAVFDYQPVGSAGGVSHGNRICERAAVYGGDFQTAEPGGSRQGRQRHAGCVQLFADAAAAVGAVRAQLSCTARGRTRV
jgi:hypothetical protein